MKPQTAVQMNTPMTGTVDIKIVPGSVPTVPNLSTLNQKPSTLTAAVLALPVTKEPFIGMHEMFHVEMMEDANQRRLFVSLGRAMERVNKSPADKAHIHALAEELAHLAGLALAETRCDAAGVVGKQG